MPKRALWSDIVDDSIEDARPEEDDMMPAGDLSPAASFCSTQFSWGDELDRHQSLSSLQFGADNDASAAPVDVEVSAVAQCSMSPMAWTQQNVMLPAVFVACPVMTVVDPNLANVRMQGSVLLNIDESQVATKSPAQHCSPLKRAKTGSVKKSFLKQGTQGGQGRPAAMENAKQLANRALPPKASEEDWQRRLQKRHGIVALIKESPEYHAFAAHRNGSRRTASMARTPSPNDRSISKRQWEEKVQKWRSALRKCHSSENQE